MSVVQGTAINRSCDFRLDPIRFSGGFAVLMAVYRRDDPVLFRRAVDSVYTNTLVPDDFVLVVDGPIPPALQSVVRELERAGAFRVIALDQNVGLARALNHGLQHINTEWILRADADDLNANRRFERQASALMEAGGNLDLIGGAIAEIDIDGTPLAIREVPLTREQIVRRLKTRNPFNHMTVAYRTALARSVGGYPVIHLKEDYALWATMIAHGARCSNLPDVLVFATAGRAMYRRRGGWRHACSEIDLQRHLYTLRHTRAISAMVYGGARALSSLLPTALRAFMYERLLRVQYNTDQV